MNINPKVVDTSHYDKIVSIEAARDQGHILGVINKATEGPGMVDMTFAARRVLVQGAGMLYGAYHFLRPGDMRAQAEHFLETVDDAAGILLALDHEDPKVPLSDAKDWLQHVHDAVGRWPVLYSGFLIKQQLGHAIDPLLKQCRLWLAQYAAVPIAPANWGDPWLWQYTGDGSGPQPHNVPGITIAGNGIDINHYGFSDDQLREEWAS